MGKPVLSALLLTSSLSAQPKAHCVPSPEIVRMEPCCYQLCYLVGPLQFLNELSASCPNVHVLVHLGCSDKTTILWVAYRQQKFISHYSGGRKVQDQADSTSGEGSLPGS